MRFQQWRRPAMLALLLAVWPAGNGAGAEEPGRFAYYTLALSWSPTYCETEGRTRAEPQCSGQRPYAFVLHGLWPQHEQGWPEYCRTRGRVWVPEDVVRAMLDIMPSRALIIHQYRKHGVCSGLAPEAYFAAARRAFETVRIPARYLRPTQPVTVSPQEVVHDFLATNPELSQQSIAVACGRGRRLREVRICLSRGLAPIPCGPNETQRRLCALDRIVLPPVRGRAQGP